MILLTDYELPSVENSATAFVTITPASPFYEARLGGVPGCVGLEYMAQAMALCTGFYRRSRGLSPQLGFLLGSRRLTMACASFAAGRTYRVQAACSYFDESFGSFECTIHDGCRQVMHATLTAFQPAGEVTPEMMEEYS